MPTTLSISHNTRFKSSPQHTGRRHQSSYPSNLSKWCFAPRSIWKRGILLGFFIGYTNHFVFQVHDTTTHCLVFFSMPWEEGWWGPQPNHLSNTQNKQRRPPPPPPLEDIDESTDYNVTMDDLYWWDPFVSNISRAWKPSVDPTRWCLAEPPTQHPPLRGMILVSTYSVATNQLQAISNAIARRVAQRVLVPPSRPSSLTSENEGEQLRLRLPEVPPPSHDDGDYRDVINQSINISMECLQYAGTGLAEQNRQASLTQPRIMWAFVRWPADRDVDHYFHYSVGRGQASPTMEAFRSTIQTSMKGHQSRYLDSGLDNYKLWKPKQPKDMAYRMRNQIFARYNFLGIVERMEESLAVMKLLWGLQAYDLIVLDDENNDQAKMWDDPNFYHYCQRKPHAFVTRRMNHYLHRGHYVMNNPDILLYHAANRSLDKTIQRLGQDRVDETIQEIRKLQQTVQAACQHKVIYPCSEEGFWRKEESLANCYKGGTTGCGYQCIDQVLLNLQEKEDLKQEQARAQLRQSQQQQQQQQQQQ